MQLRFGEPRYWATYECGAGLDAIGALSKVEIPRCEAETDQAYRERLIVKLDWLCGVAKPVEIAGADELSKYRIWLETSTTVELDGLPYLVQQVGLENGRFGAWLMPAIPLQLTDHEWRGAMGAETKAPEDESRQNHLRDAVRNNW